MKLIPIISACLMPLLFSCAMGTDEAAYANKEFSGGNGIQTAIATLKNSADGTVYLQLDEHTTMLPLSLPIEYGGMQRIVCQFTFVQGAENGFDCCGQVLWAEAIDEGALIHGSVPSSDGLDIIGDWMTCVEDGYLTVHFRALWGQTGIRHNFTVVSGTDPYDPYVLTLVHDAAGDAQDVREEEALVCFDINSLPDTGEDYKTLTLKWITLEGDVSAKTFGFRTRR